MDAVFHLDKGARIQGNPAFATNLNICLLGIVIGIGLSLIHRGFDMRRNMPGVRFIDCAWRVFAGVVMVSVSLWFLTIRDLAP